MLYEDDVVDAVVAHIEQRGWEVMGVAHAHQRGNDIEASKSGIYLFVEAKGEGSSKIASKRYGKVFNRGQVGSHVAVALYRAMTWVTDDPNVRPALAFPDNAHHREKVRAVSHALERAGIGVFWVATDLTVTLHATWEL